MDEVEAEIERAIKAGTKNLQALNLLKNWCFHAEHVRSGGRGMIEAQTGLPIGHMGVQCKFSEKNGMLSWDFEDAIYDFYKSNCKDCVERTPVGLPNITDFIVPREQKAERRAIEQKLEREKRIESQIARSRERSLLRNKVSHQETFVLDLLDEIDKDNVLASDPRLEQLANLAPEVFSTKVINHLLPDALRGDLPYSNHGAKALLKTSISKADKITISIRLIRDSEYAIEAIDLLTSEVRSISWENIQAVLKPLVSLAVKKPPSMEIYGHGRHPHNDKPIKIIYENRKEEYAKEIMTLLDDANPNKIRFAAKMLLAAGDSDLLRDYANPIFIKLIRRKHLLPAEKNDSDTLFYLRQVCALCFETYPSESDALIQRYSQDGNEIEKLEADRIYKSALEYKYGEILQVTEARKIAFTRLLWSAVQNSSNSSSDAVQFFAHPSDVYSVFFAENFELLFGAAVTLSDKINDVSFKDTLQDPGDFLAKMERSNHQTSIMYLQRSLLHGVALGAKAKGVNGITAVLDLYQNLPENRLELRGDVIRIFSKLIYDAESLQLVLPYWYRSLFDHNTLVRASAAQSWENLPHESTSNIPDLFYEALSILLVDPYVMVHQSVTHALQRKPFPIDKHELVKGKLLNLAVIYSNQANSGDQNSGGEFLVACIDALSRNGLTENEITGNLGRVLTELILKQDGRTLHSSLDRLRYRFKNCKHFIKVAFAAASNDYTRSISIDNAMSFILESDSDQLETYSGEIQDNFRSLLPIQPRNFAEAMQYVIALTKAKKYGESIECLGKLLQSIPEDKRYANWKIQVELFLIAVQIESSILNGETVQASISRWNELRLSLRSEDEESA